MTVYGKQGLREVAETGTSPKADYLAGS